MEFSYQMDRCPMKQRTLGETWKSISTPRNIAKSTVASTPPQIDDKDKDKAVRDHLNIVSKPENSPKAARGDQDVARISILRREASEPIMHHIQASCKKRARTVTATRLKSPIEVADKIVAGTLGVSEHSIVSTWQGVLDPISEGF
ncbi:hypothetical protein BGX31_004522 [Mortierella sp. GBA43]|nr:hypothetical protein BGX31_004522 [Mortierella sp. GBA43]